MTTADGSTVPVIRSQLPSISVAAGASVSFSIIATGTSALDCEWFKGGTAISGADSASYSVTESNRAATVANSSAVSTSPSLSPCPAA